MKDYRGLLEYYKQCFNIIDCFHFNSKVSQCVFKSYLNPKSERIVSITHNGIKDNRRLKAFDDGLLHIGFIGNSTPYKGLPLLISMLKEIGLYQRWELSVWGNKIGKEKSMPIYYKGMFSKENISRVYTKMDVLIVPSIWKETFSFVTLEALSYGVPVIVSSNVGAQDIVRRYSPKFIYSSQSELKELLLSIIYNRSALIDFNSKILDLEWEHSMEKHAQEIIDKVYLNK